MSTHTTSTKAFGCLLVTVALSAGVAATASADAAPQNDVSAHAATNETESNQSDSSSTLETIVVTATKRSERLQDVPMAISAFGAQQIHSLGLTDVSSLARATPSLSFNDLNAGGSGEADVMLRGLSTAYGLAPVVSVYIDDIPLDFRTDIAAGATIPDFFDLERIEVLRGPQGTIFGSSSLGGAIRFITAKPDPKQLSAAADASYWATQGGGGSYWGKGDLNLPLSDDLAVRFVGTDTREGGWINRVTPLNFSPLTVSPGIVKHDENVSESRTGRVELRWTPSDTLTITPEVLYLNSAFTNLDMYRAELGPFLRPHLFDDTGSFSTYLTSLAIEKQFPSFTLTSATSYASKNTYTALDLSEQAESYSIQFGFGPVLEPGVLGLQVRYRQFSQEVRATSTSSGPFRWILGAYFSRDSESNSEYENAEQFISTLGTANIVDYSAPVDDRQIAGFGQLTYSFRHQLDLSGGLRVYQLKESQSVTFGGPLSAPNVPVTNSQNTGVSPKVSATFRPTNDLSLYATYSTGFREGGPNTGIIPSSNCSFIAAYRSAYAPDKSKNYEVGVKGTPIPRVSVNLDAFQLDWVNFQAPVYSTCGTFIVNIGNARTRGVELDTQIALLDHLSIYGGGSFDDGRITRVDPTLAGAGVGSSGDELINAPRVQFNLGAKVDVPLRNSSNLYLRANWQYTGQAYTAYNFYTDPAYMRHSFNNIDTTLGWQSAQWDLELFVHNLTNALQIQAINPGWLEGQDLVPGRPRSYGIDVRYWYK